MHCTALETVAFRWKGKFFGRYRELWGYEVNGNYMRVYFLVE